MPAAGRERTTSAAEVRGNSKAGNAFVLRGRGPAARCPRHLREGGGLGARMERVTLLSWVDDRPPSYLQIVAGYVGTACPAADRSLSV